MIRTDASAERSAFLAKLEGLFEPDTLFSRQRIADESAKLGLGVAKSSLDSMASRGTGPTFVKVGSRVLYRWGDFVEWVGSKSTVARSTSEHRAKAAA